MRSNDRRLDGDNEGFLRKGTSAETPSTDKVEQQQDSDRDARLAKRISVNRGKRFRKATTI